MTFKKKTQKRMKSKLPNGLITVYKVVNKYRGSYHPLCYGGRFRVGLNTARNQDIYDVDNLWGFHSFKTKSAAKKLFRRGWITSYRELVKFQIRKTWIKEIGKETCGCICYITDRIVSPSLRDKSSVVKG